MADGQKPEKDMFGNEMDDAAKAKTAEFAKQQAEEAEKPHPKPDGAEIDQDALEDNVRGFNNSVHSTPNDTREDVYTSWPWSLLQNIILGRMAERNQLYSYAGHIGKVVTRALPPVLQFRRDENGELVQRTRELSATHIVRPTDAHQILTDIENVVRFIKQDKQGKLHAVRPTREVGANILATGGTAPCGVTLPALHTVIDHPVIAQNGDLIKSRNEYDPATGIFYAIEQRIKLTEFEHVESAWIVLAAWLDEIEWASDADFRRAIAFALTLLTRKTLYGGEPSPVFFFTASLSSSGKTMVVRAIHKLITGRDVPITPWPSREEEFEKTLAATIMTGCPVVLFDNVPRGEVVKRSHLEGYSTAGVYRPRTLGRHEVTETPTSTIPVLTGNNIEPGGDLPNRVVTCRIEPTTDSPATRDYKVDIFAEAEANRSRLISALYRIWQEGQKNNTSTVKGRFPGWAKHVGNAVQAGHRENLFESWEESAEGEGHKTEEIIALCERMKHVREITQMENMSKNPDRQFKLVGPFYGMTYSELIEYCPDELAALIYLEKEDGETDADALKRIGAKNVPIKLRSIMGAPAQTQAGTWKLTRQKVGIRPNRKPIYGIENVWIDRKE